MSTGIDGKSEQELFARHEQLKAEKPWLKDQHYFKNCRMTRLALMKIWCHAHEGALNVEDGAPREIIGILLGYVADETVCCVSRALAHTAPFDFVLLGHCD
jgi:hypothetical protein